MENGIKKATSPSLISGQWTESDDYKQQTKDAVEGAGIFPLIGSDKYILMYDVYMKGKYQFTESVDLEHFKVIDHAISMDFHPRHGTVIPITQKELQRFSRRMVNRKVSDLKEEGQNPSKLEIILATASCREDDFVERKFGHLSSTNSMNFKRVIFISR